MMSQQIKTPIEYKETRAFPKVGAGYYTFISRDDFVFRDGKKEQYTIINKDENLLITILSAEDDIKNIAEIFKNINLV